MELLQEILYWLTSGLLVPCIAFLLYMLIRGLFSAGQYVMDSAKIRSAVTTLNLHFKNYNENTPLPDMRPLRCAETLKELVDCDDADYATLLVTDFEVSTDKYLGQFSNMARLGPITGLVGTLIPMGPALQGLADGNIQQLAGQMQIAFTTTTIGLTIGALGLILYQLHKRHSVRELAILDLALDKKKEARK